MPPGGREWAIAANQGDWLGALLDFVSRVSLDDASQVVRSRVSMVVLDCVGGMLLGADSAVCACLERALDQLGTRAGHCGVVGRTGSYSIPSAGLLMAAALNAHDYDPIGPEGHIAVACVSSALAVGQLVGASVGEMLTACMAALEAGGRLGVALRRVPAHYAVRGNPHAILAAALAAGRLLDLDPRRLAQAVGIAAYSCMPPTLTHTMSGTPVAMIKYDNLPSATRLGIEAAVMADCGVSGDSTIFAGPGSLDACLNFPGFAADEVAAGLGTRWVADQFWFKRYPVASSSIPVLETVARVAAARSDGIEDIEAIRVTIWPPVAPAQRKAEPETVDDVGWSLPYQIGLLLAGVPRWQWRRPVGARDRGAVEAIAGRVVLQQDGTREAGPRRRSAGLDAGPSCHVELQCRNGVFAGAADGATPMEDGEIEAKFRESSGLRLDASAAQRVIEILRCPGTVSVRDLASLLAGRSGDSPSSAAGDADGGKDAC